MSSVELIKKVQWYFLDKDNKDIQECDIGLFHCLMSNRVNEGKIDIVIKLYNVVIFSGFLESSFDECAKWCVDFIRNICLQSIDVIGLE